MKLRHVAILMVMEALLLCAGVAIASRNSSGTMSAINGPYTSGSVISSSVVNARFSDIETELTSSLDRSGRGAMLAQLQLASGTVATPGLGFSSETGSGLYRIGASDIGFAISGTKVGEWTANGYRAGNGAVATPSLSFFNDTGSGLYRIGSNDIGFAINGALVSEWSATGLTHTLPDNDASIKLLSGNAAKYAGMSLGRTAVTFKIGVAGAINNFATGTAAGDAAIVTTGAKLWFDTNAGSGTPSLAIAAANGGVVIGGGTAITATYEVSSGAISPGIINANTCNNIFTGTTTGAQAGATCSTGSTDVTSGIVYYCLVTADQCSVVGCNVTTAGKTPTASSTYRCRAFNH